MARHRAVHRAICKGLTNGSTSLKAAASLVKTGHVMPLACAVQAEGAPDKTSAPPTTPHTTLMLNYAVIFFIVALVAAVLGFGGIAGAAAGIAKILFFVFLVLFVISFVMGRKPKL